MAEFSTKYQPKEVPKYEPKFKVKKITFYSKWFDKNVEKYVPYHSNKKLSKKFHIKNSINISIFSLLIIFFLSLTVFAYEEVEMWLPNNLNHIGRWVKTLGIYLTWISAVIEVLLLIALILYTIYTCLFFHLSFEVFAKDKDFSDIKKVKRLPKHSIKYLMQLGYIDRKVYELIVSK